MVTDRGGWWRMRANIQLNEVNGSGANVGVDEGAPTEEVWTRVRMRGGGRETRRRINNSRGLDERPTWTGAWTMVRTKAQTN